MDYAKLTHLNGVWLRQADDARLTADVLHRLAAMSAGKDPGFVLDDAAGDRIRRLMPGLKERAKTLVELAASAAFLVSEEAPALDAKAASLLTPDARAMLRDVGEVLAGADFEESSLDAALRGFAERTGRKLGAVAQPLRAALTGSTMSPGIDAVLATLGRDTSLQRIAKAADAA